MAITTRSVTVTVNRPSGVLAGTKFRFILRGTGLTGDGNLVTNAPDYEEKTSTAAGLISVDLWPNDDGSSPTYYEVQEFQTKSNGRQVWEKIGAMLVPSSGAATIDVMLLEDLPGNVEPHTVLTTAQYDALVASMITQSEKIADPADTTTGKVVTVPFMGLGGQAGTIGNADAQGTIKPGGHYHNPAGGSTGGMAATGTLDHKRGGSSTGETQLYIVTAGGGTQAPPGTILSRGRAAGAWGALLAHFNVGNVFAPLAAIISGQPTGGLMPYGENANGKWFKLASGLQVCTHQIDLGSIIANGAGTLAELYRTAGQNWTFPAAFAAGAVPVVGISAPIAIAGGRKIVTNGHGAVSNTSVQSIYVARINDDATADNIIVNLSAIGPAL